MSGMNGFVHRCIVPKVNVIPFRNTINSTGFTDEEIKKIWEFYVTKSMAEKSSQSVKLENYGWDINQSKTTGLPALENELSNAADSCVMCFVRARTIKDTLSAMDLSNSMICTEHPRAVLKQEYRYDHNENEEVQIESGESRIVCLFRHIRNAFAHGNTYFFENGNLLFEDKDKGESGAISARIIIPQRALLTWIQIVDKDNILGYRNEE